MRNRAFRKIGVLLLSICAVALSSCGGAGPTPLNGTTAVSAVNIAISPQTVSLAPGTSQTFTATVNNATNTSVGWLVNGIVGGNSVFGTIDKHGNYAAPLFVPTPATVSVTAVAQADSTKSASAAAKINGTPVPVTLTISPVANPGSTLTAYVNQELLFTATVTGVADTSVSWEINGQPPATADPSLGTLVPSQTSQDEATFTSPATVPSGKQVTITAVSSAYPSVTASSIVTISKLPTAAGVYVSPTTANIFEGQSLLFTATVTGTAGTSVTWRVDGVGSIVAGSNDTATYTAPATVTGPTNATVTVTSTSDPTQSAEASITISIPPPNVVVTISPAAATLYLGQSKVFTATVTGAADTSVSWLLNGNEPSKTSSNLGTLVPVAGTNQASYTAPSQVPGEAITIAAVSNANPAKVANAIVAVALGASVRISPQSVTVYTGLTQVFVATVSGEGVTDTSVSWQVNGISNGNSSVGTIQAGANSSATYTAPATVPQPAQVTVTAVSNAVPSQTASATVAISKLPTQPGVYITGPSSTVFVGQPCSLTAVVVGLSNPAVSWQVNGITGGNSSVGTIVGGPPTGEVSTATYTEPAVSGPTKFTITAVSVSNPARSASAVVTVVPLPPPPGVTISPQAATLYPGVTQVFTATVTGEKDTSVSWQVDGIADGNSQLGTIQPGANNTATYMPPAQVTSSFQVTVTAISNEQPSVFGSATVTLIPPPPPITVNVLPSSANVVVNTTQQYSATVTNAENPTVTWQVNHVTGGNISTTGSIDVNGNYTAPAAVPSPATVEIEAVSNQDNKTTGTATATVGAAQVIQISLAPLSASVQATLEQPFTATVTGTTDPAVTFAVNGEVGGDSTIGTISWSLPVGNVTTATYLAPATVPSPAQVQITAVSTADNTTTSAPATVTITSPPPPIQVDVSPNSQVLIVGQSQIFTAVVLNTTDYLVSWSLSGPNCSGLTCGTIVDNGTNPASATYTAPQSVPTPNATVTVTATADADSTAQGTSTVTVEPNVTPSIAILPASATLKAGSNTFSFSAVIQNAPADTQVTWSLGCISLYDGDANNACFDLDFDMDGPGCLTMPGQFKKCGAYAQSAPGNDAVTYTSPGSLYTTAFQANACQATNSGTAQVPLTATMTVDGTQYTTVPPVCITITPP